ncbi:MAG TPA: thiamine pyrophosphate-dependent enzyme [Candidatus Absconditabacterales bacterium]|nr:thiamine pyrophosphate-dependent enzyme [Candidatus Absconditabacterales bacterium]
MRNNLNKFQRCPGCGNFIIHLAIKQALKELNIPTEKTVIVSGIGCSGKMSQYIDGYGAETLHGRGLPFATGVKLANDDLVVISYAGDGDSYGIGLSHLLHSSRRDINLVHIVADNQNYALTTGQASPTTPEDIKTTSTPDGNQIQPFAPLKLTESAGCKYNIQVSDKDLAGLKKAIIDGIKHQGFSHINVQQTCPSFKKW